MEIGAILISLFIILVIINKAYKNSNHYKNQFIYSQKYEHGVPNDINMANLGSTYSKYAFETMSTEGSFNFALCSQSIEYDLNLLKKYSSKLLKGGKIFIVVTTGSILLGKELANNKDYYNILKKNEILHFSWKEYCEYKFPILCNPKLVKYLIKDVKKYSSIYDIFPADISKEESEKLMFNMSECWIKLFDLSDLRNVSFSEENKKNIKKNLDNITEMIQICRNTGVTPIIVVPPFSNRINKYFSEDFKKQVLNNNLCLLAKNEHVQYLNYQDDDEFQERYEWFCDGGFRLNRLGGARFLEKLLKDIQS